MLADVLERLSNTQVLLLGILPAGDWSDTVSQYRWPNALTPGITSANFWWALAEPSMHFPEPYLLPEINKVQDLKVKV